MYAHIDERLQLIKVEELCLKKIYRNIDLKSFEKWIDEIISDSLKYNKNIFIDLMSLKIRYIRLLEMDYNSIERKIRYFIFRTKKNLL